jgi:hypothetical protein
MRQELITLRELGSSQGLVVSVVLIVLVFCVVFVYFFIFVPYLLYPMLSVSLDCLRPVSCVPNVVSFSGLSSSRIFCTQCCQFLWIVFVPYLLYPMLSVSLDCLRPVSFVPNVVSFSRLSILDYIYSYGFLLLLFP